MVLLASEGKKVSEISQILKRNPHTVRDWLKRYNASGIHGLNRKYSPKDVLEMDETKNLWIFSSSGLKELASRFRKYVWHYNAKQLPIPRTLS